MPISKQRQQLTIIGNRIRRMREALGYTQEEFAEHIGLDRAYYGGIERGERNFTVVNAIRVARGLGVDVGELVPKSAYRIEVSSRKRRSK